MAKKKNTFTVNGRKYIGRVFDFNTAADLDFMGLSVSDFGKKNLAMARAYLALYNGNDVEWAGREIQAHIVNGGTLTDLFEVFGNSVSDSDFFQAITSNKETETQQESEEKTEEELEKERDAMMEDLLAQGKHNNLSFYAFTATPKPKTLQTFGVLVEKGKTPEEIADLTARMPVRIHLVYSPDINSYLGRESMQYIMKDYRILP